MKRLNPASENWDHSRGRNGSRTNTSLECWHLKAPDRSPVGSIIILLRFLVVTWTTLLICCWNLCGTRKVHRDWCDRYWHSSSFGPSVHGSFAPAADSSSAPPLTDAVEKGLEKAREP